MEERERCIREFSVFICSAGLAIIQYPLGVYCVLALCFSLRQTRILLPGSSSISKTLKVLCGQTQSCYVNSWFLASSIGGIGSFINELN